MLVPYWDGIGPRHVQVGVHSLALEARLHAPRAVWPGYRTRDEDTDTRIGRIRTPDCLM